MLNKLHWFKQVLDLILLISRPGAGKGTLVANLMAILDPGEIYEIAMSAVIDKRSEAFDSLGMRLAAAKKAMLNGGLVDDQPVMEALEERIIKLQAEGAQRIILDGCIRTEKQAKAFIATGVPFIIIHLECDDGVAIERIQRRAQIEGRPDDADMDTIMNRFRTYDEKTAPILKLLHDHNPREYHTINTNGCEREIVVRALRVLGYKGQRMHQICSKLDARLEMKRRVNAQATAAFFQPSNEKLGQPVTA